MRQLLGWGVVGILVAPGRPGFSQVGDIRYVHDPVMMKEGDTYYVFSSGQARGETIIIRRSRDLITWESVGMVFDDLPGWAQALEPGDWNLWAPDISYFDGEYHLYYAVSTVGTNHSAIGLATNKTLDPGHAEYEWVDKGKVIESRPGVDDWNTIDPNIIIDEGGIPWLAFGSFWSGIKMRLIDLRTGLLFAEDPVLYPLAARPEVWAIEAPFIFHRRGYYYLFVSFDHCCRGVESDYKIMVGRSRRVTGPYVDRGGRPMMEGAATLVLAGYGRFRGPGHNGVLADGGRDWLVHHFYDGDEGGLWKLQIRPLLWADDGWPLAGEPVSGGPSPAVPRSVAGTWEHLVDFENSHQIRFYSNGRIDSPDGRDTWSMDGDTLVLEWPRPEAPGGAWIDRCVISEDGESYVGRNQIDLIVRGTRADSLFVRGDADGDGTVGLSDVIQTLFHIFRVGGATFCPDALDANDDGSIDLADAITLLRSLFVAGVTIPAPHPVPGPDRTPDPLGC